MKQIYMLRALLVLVPSLFVSSLSAQDVTRQDSVSTISNDSASATSPDVDVVNVGFGKYPSHRVASAISTVQGVDIEKNFSLNLGNSLYGRVPGLTVAQGGSEPGASTPSLFVRGINTFGSGSNGPLYVIDGYISNGLGFANAAMQLVPEEIESVSVLKDAAATAVYGARAANGVILITTKTGKEGPLKVSFTTRQGFNHAQYLPKFLNSADYATLYNEALANDKLSPRYTDADIQTYRDGSDPYLYPNVNWYNEVLRKNAAVSSYDLTFNGGDKFVRYFVVVNALNSQGLFKKFGDLEEESSNSRYSKYNFRTNLEISLTKRLSAEFRIAGAIDQAKNPNTYTTDGTFNLLASLPPNSFPVYNPDGSYGAKSGYSNPVANLRSTGFSQTNSRTMLSSLKLTHQLDMITKGLSISGAVSVNNYFKLGSIKSKLYRSYSLTKGPSGEAIPVPVTTQLTTLAGTEEVRDQYRNFIIQAFLNYNRVIGKSAVTGMVMFNTDQVTLYGPTSDPLVPTANSTDPYNHNNAAGRLTYAYSEKYLAEFSGGYMGSEAFAPGKRYGFFPAGALGWVVSNEGFLKRSEAINFLKLRGSYGLVGNDIITSQGLTARYAYAPTFGGGGYFFGTGNNGVGGLAENTIANQNFTWEKEKVLDIGMDATIFKRLNVSFDYFDRNRYDILVPSNGTTPLLLGAPIPSLNQGKTNSTGFDASLRYNKNDGKLQFFIEANVSYFKNKVVFNAEAVQLNEQLYGTGRRIGQLYGLKAIGFYSEADIQNRTIDPESVPGVLTEVIRAGDIKYQDIGGPNGVPDGIIDSNDRMPMGNFGLPNFTAGLNAGVRYKGFDLNLVFQGVTGNKVYLGGNYFYAFQNSGQIAPIALDRWTPETAESATYPRLSSKNNNNNYQFSSFWERDGSFVKLRSAEIGYTLPAALTAKVKIQTTRIFINGTNIFSLDHIKYGDPESLTGYPVTRTITAGIKLQL